MPPGFEAELNGRQIGVHLTTYRSGSLLLNQVKILISFKKLTPFLVNKTERLSLDTEMSKTRQSSGYTAT